MCDNESMHSLEWACGFLEGEGSFLVTGRHPRIVISAGQTHREPLDALRSILGGAVFGPYDPRNPNHSSFYIWRMRGRPALDVMRRVRSSVSTRRQAEIDRCIAWHDKHFSPRTCASGDCDEVFDIYSTKRIYCSRRCGQLSRRRQRSSSQG